MRPLVIIVFASMLAVIGSGCLRSGIIVDEHNVHRLDDEAVKTIVVWHTYSDEETRVFEEEIIPTFERDNPGIRVESIRQGSNVEYQAAIIARASAEKTPDVIRMDYNWVPRFASFGLLKALEEFPDYEQVAAQQRGHMLHTNQYDGHVYGLPLNMNTKAAIYNRKLLSEAGLSESPDSLIAVVQAAREHKFIIGMIGLELWSSLPYFHGLGGVLADEGFTQTSGYFNSDRSVHAVQELLDLYHEGILNPGILTGTSDLWNDLYKDTRMLMIDEGPWYYSILLNSSTLEVDLLEATIPAPFPANGQYGSIIGGESLVMTKGTRVQDEAWAFIRFMLQKETQQTIYDQTGLFPTNMEAFRVDDEISLIEDQYMEPYVKGIDDAFYRPPLPDWYKIERFYYEALKRIFVDGADVREALDEAVVKMDELLR